MLFLSLMVFVLGLCCGSFVNMLSYRTAVRYEILNLKFKNLKTNEKRSFCDFCGRQLHWWENIPVISWMVQNGRSRCCQKNLPIEYPIVETITGLIFLFIFYHFSFIIDWKLVVFFVVATMLVFLAVFDFKYMILPDFATIIVGVGALGLWFLKSDSPLPYVWAGLGGCGFLLLLHILTKGNGMGMGDVKFALVMGFLLGWQKLILAMYIAFIVGAVWGVWMIYFKKMSRKSQIPFGPFLILGTLMAWWLGDWFIKTLYF